MYCPKDSAEATQYQVSYPKTITITSPNEQKNKYNQNEVTL
jgi:hypothetical protein